MNEEKKREDNEEMYKLSASLEKASYRKNKKYNNKTLEGRNRLFRESVRYGRIYPCVCCERLCFYNGVKIYSQEYHEAINKRYHDISLKAMGFRILPDNRNSFYICLTCKRYVENGKIPPMSSQNSLTLIDLSPYDELQLTELENAMIALNIIFQKVFKLPKSRWPGMKDKTINVPVYESDVLNTIKTLPRTPTDAGIIPINFKRKVAYKNNHMVQFVSVPKILKALMTLKEFGNRYYQFVPIKSSFEEECREHDIDGFNFLFPEDELFDDEEEILQTRQPCTENKSIDNVDNEKSSRTNSLQESKLILHETKNESIISENLSCNEELLEDEFEKEDIEYEVKDPIKK